ncbi:MAG: DNA-protecting protein DprA [Gemmatimonadetes bacterium]|nr:DNA-protecting protein DprA [Gemmatimonadota bacterium]
MSNAAYIALALVPGVGRVRLEILMQAFGSADAVLAATFRQLNSVVRISRAAATAIHKTTTAAGTEIIDKVAGQGGVVLTPADAAFPGELRQIPDAPTLLFAKGRLDLLQGPCVALVGSRDHSRYGADVASELSAGIAAAGITVVSGMARGLDAVAHQAALDAGGGGGGGTVGVLGNGLGVIYPAANRVLYERVIAAGCLLTEFPPGERPNAGSFPRRNRLISGLARATVVLEARDGSGALITADCALAQGREVMAVPGPITSPLSRGTNRLIQMGAKPVLELRDVLEEYGISDVPEVSLPADLSDAERRALEALGDGAELVDDFTARLACAPAESLAVLTSLEIRGLVAQGPGKVFRATKPFGGRSGW